jgi:hypothetical protein
MLSSRLTCEDLIRKKDKCPRGASVSKHPFTEDTVIWTDLASSGLDDSGYHLKVPSRDRTVLVRTVWLYICCVLALVFEPASAISSTPIALDYVTANTGTTNTSTYYGQNNYLAKCSRYKKFSDGTEYAVGGLTDSNNGYVTVHKMDGEKLGDLQLSNQYVNLINLAIKETGSSVLLFVSRYQSGDNGDVYTIQSNSGSLSFNGEGKVCPDDCLLRYHSAHEEPNTNYVYGILYDSNAAKDQMLRIDITQPIASSTTYGAQNTPMWTTSYRRFNSIDSLSYNGYGTMYVYIYDMLAMSLTKTVLMSSLGGYSPTMAATLQDNLDDKKYITMNYGGDYILRGAIVDMVSTAGAIITATNLNIEGSYYHPTAMLNFGSFNYFGVAIGYTWSIMKLIVFDKGSSLTTKFTYFTRTGGNAILDYYNREYNDFLSEARQTTTASGFVMYPKNANNFQSYYLLFDNCIELDSNNVCIQCRRSYVRDTLDPGNSCILNTALPSGQGPNWSTGLQTPCDDPNCDDCTSDYLSCNMCLDGYYAHRFVTPIKCLLPADIPDGYGARTTVTAGVVVDRYTSTCSVWNCDICNLDYLKCQKCSSGLWVYTISNPTQCRNAGYTMSGSPSFGPDLSGNYYLPCQDSNCYYCSNDYTKCTYCKPSYYVYPPNSTCVNSSNVPIGYGINGGSSTLSACMPSKNCKTCVNYYAICDSCSLENGYYLYTPSSNPSGRQCLLPANFPNGFGADDASVTAKLCAVTGCLLCNLNYQQCTKCDVSNKYYLETSLNTCVYVDNISYNFGADIRNPSPDNTYGQIVACQETWCDNCRADFTVCLTCDESAHYYLNATSGNCILYTDIIPGYGPNLVNKHIEACQSTSCIDCHTDILMCTKCNATEYYFLDVLQNKCFYFSQIPNGYGGSSDTGLITPCQLANCLSCQQNYIYCSQCNYTADWYYDQNSQTCVTPPDITNYFGACTKTGLSCIIGTVYQCYIEGCLICQKDNTQCEKCDKDAGYYYKDDTVYTLPKVCNDYNTLPSGIGADLVSGKIKLCTDPGCSKCQANYQLCLECKYTENPPFYLDPLTERCTLLKDVSDGYGVNVDTHIIDSCVDPKCTDCKNNITFCTRCDTNSFYYLDTSTNSCVYVDNIAQGFGANILPYPVPNPQFGKVVACGKPNCLFCQSDYTVCTGCDMNNDYFLSLDNPPDCIKVGTIAPGYGGNRETGRVAKCEQSQCLLCQYDTTICTKCDLKKDYYFEAGFCYPASLAPYRFGIDRLTGLLEECLVAHCLTCNLNNAICTDCDYMDGYYLEGNVCQKADTGLLLSLNPRKPTNVDLSLILTTAITLPVNQTLFYQALTPVLSLTVIFYLPDTKTQVSILNIATLTPLEEGIRVDIILKEFPPQKYYTVFVKTQKAMNVTLGEEMYRVGGTNGTFQYESKLSLLEVAGAKAQGEAIGSLVGSGGNTGLAITTVLSTAVALDPTGVLMKFNQILKVINKLYFININYGTRLTVFLAQIGGISTGGNNREQVYFSKATRGKITRGRLPLDMMAEMSFKPYIYLVSFLIQMINLGLMAWKRCNIYYLYFVYYSLKVHLIIFNLVFIDFIWFGSRTLLQSRDLSSSTYLFTFLILLSLSVDLTFVLSNCLTDSYWLERYRRYRLFLHYRGIEEKKMKLEDVRIFTWKRKHKNSKTPMPKELERPKIVQKDFSKRPIDYQRTLDYIHSNPHLFAISANALRPGTRVYFKSLPRSLFFIFLLRGIVYQGIIIAGSYIPGATVGLLISVEIMKISHALYCHIRYRYLKTILLLLMEIMQSTFMLAFLIIAMLVVPKSEDDVIENGYQDAGIWIVMLSCIAEYLLLITYIAVAAYEFFKNRTLNKRTSAHLNNSFIKYQNDNELYPDRVVPKVEDLDKERQLLKPLSNVVGLLAAGEKPVSFGKVEVVPTTNNLSKRKQAIKKSIVSPTKPRNKESIFDEAIRKARANPNQKYRLVQPGETKILDPVDNIDLTKNHSNDKLMMSDEVDTNFSMKSRHKLPAPQPQVNSEKGKGAVVDAKHSIKEQNASSVAEVEKEQDSLQPNLEKAKLPVAVKPTQLNSSTITSNSVKDNNNSLPLKSMLIQKYYRKRKADK